MARNDSSTARASVNAAWSDFWADRQRGTGGGCLPAHSKGVEDAQRTAWRTFAKKIRKNGRALDLATGDGRVLQWVGGERTDLKLTGVDLARELPPPPPRTKMLSGVPMEKLPFSGRRFDAVISQFGYEYGATDEISREVARVAALEAKLGLMVHRGDGPILEHNLTRRDQIRWVLDDHGLIDKVMAGLTLGAGAAQAIMPMINSTVQEAARLFGQGSVGWEIPEAIRQSLVLGARDTRSGLVGMIKTIEAKARNEITRIEALQGACRTADMRDAIEQQLTEVGFIDITTSRIDDPSGQAFADLITARFDPSEA